VSNEMVVTVLELLLKHWHKSTLVHDKKPMTRKLVSWHGSELKSPGIRNRSDE